MYWKDELDALYQKNTFGKRLWKQLVGNQVELLLKNQNNPQTGRNCFGGCRNSRRYSITL